MEWFRDKRRKVALSLPAVPPSSSHTQEKKLNTWRRSQSTLVHLCLAGDSRVFLSWSFPISKLQVFLPFVQSCPEMLCQWNFPLDAVLQVWIVLLHRMGNNALMKLKFSSHDVTSFFFFNFSVLFSPCVSVGTKPTEAGGVGLGGREKKRHSVLLPATWEMISLKKKPQQEEKTHFQLISSWIQFVRHKSLCWHSEEQELRQGGGWALPLSVG